MYFRLLLAWAIPFGTGSFEPHTLFSLWKLMFVGSLFLHPLLDYAIQCCMSLYCNLVLLLYMQASLTRLDTLEKKYKEMRIVVQQPQGKKFPRSYFYYLSISSRPPPNTHSVYLSLCCGFEIPFLVCSE